MPAPTFPAGADLVEGSGTRSFTAVTTVAGDWLVVEIVVELGVSGTPAMSPLTWTQQNDRDDGANRTEVFQFTAQDTVGASRTIQIVPGTTAKWRARLTVVRGSAGPGTGKGTAAAQTVSVTRQAANSAMFMTVGDWAAGPVGAPAWTPGGTTQASQRGTAATYVFGRWDDSGATATASHGVSSPSYGTPSIAVLEILGTAGAGTVNGTAAADFTLTATASGARAVLATAAAALAYTAAAAGTRAVSGTAASPLPFAAAAAGTVSLGAGEVSGVAAAPLAFSAAMAGARTVLGQAATPLSLSAAGSGGRTVTGNAATLLTFVAAAAGQGSLGPATVSGLARSPLAFSVSVAGVRVVPGLASAAFGLAASGAGAASTPGAVVNRPGTGTVVRPVAGVTVRPAAGSVTQPASGIVTRPYVGVVSRL